MVRMMVSVRFSLLCLPTEKRDSGEGWRREDGEGRESPRVSLGIKREDQVGSGVRTTTLTWRAWLLRSLSLVTRTKRIRRKGGSEGVRAKRWVGPNQGERWVGWADAVEKKRKRSWARKEKRAQGGGKGFALKLFSPF
jgi:hypothetical protein